MSSDWTTKAIGELVHHKKGFAFKSKDYVESGVPVVRVSNFTEDSISQSDLKFVSVDIAQENSGVCLKAYDIVVATVGSWPNNPASVVGRTISVPTWAEKALMNQNSVILRSNSNSMLDQRFIYYQMKSTEFANHLISKAQGSANQASITLDAIFSFQLSWPNENIRRSIVEVLAALDERIELLRETNATLEAIAQALFKSWFVDFDPVRAKQQGKMPEGMDEATAALFPDSFEESELGLVPSAWSIGKIKDLASLNPESWSAKMRPNTVAYVDLANTKNNSITDIAEYSFEDAPSRARRVLRNGDTIIGTVRPGNRSFAFISNPAPNLTGSTGFAVLRPLFPENTEFVFLATTSDESIDHLAHVADGGAYPAVRPEVVSELRAVIPDKSVMAAFHDAIAPIFTKIGQAQQQSLSLAAIRDTLLPRLISGQLRIAEV